jgi:hypothetical protein
MVNVEFKSEWCYTSTPLYALMTCTMTDFLYKTCYLAVQIFHLLLIEAPQKYATT